MTLKALGNAKQGRIFIVSAPAGTGKTTLIEMLKKEFDCVAQSVSFTTRSKRKGEIEGVHYHFIEKEEFEKRLKSNEFIEHVKLFGNYYGTSKALLEENTRKGKHIILVIDTQGQQALKHKIAHTSIFIMPPSIEVLRKRIVARGTENNQVIEQRLARAETEIESSVGYDYTIVNDDREIAYEVLRSIFIAEEHRNY